MKRNDGRLTGGPLQSFRRFRADPLAFFTELGQRGDPAEVKAFWLLWIRCHLVVSPAGVKDVLTRGPHTYSRVTPDTAIFAAAVGQSLLTTEGDSWLATRRVMNPAFARRHDDAFAAAVTGATAALLERWERRRPGPDGVLEVDMVQEMRALTLAIVAQALFGVDLAASPLGRQIDALARGIDRMFRSPAIVLPSLRLPLPPNPRLARVLRALDEELYRIIDRHLAGEAPGGGTHPDLLTLLIAARDEAGGRLSRRQLRNELLDVMLAGQETTASLLIWSAAMLAANRSAEEQLHRELGGVLGGREPRADDLQRLPVLASFLQEVLRLYPPAWMIARRALTDDEIAGHRIARGSLVMLSPWVTQRHGAWWPDPVTFAPERFAPASAPAPRAAFFPFGLGPHRCIGEHLALVEAKLALATLAQRYRFRLPADCSLAPGVFPALRPAAGLTLSLQVR
jgi:cytochrome P450